MTNLEKFYKLALNLLNDRFKSVSYIDDKVSEVFVRLGKDCLTFYPNTPIRYFEYYSYRFQDELCVVGEDDPRKMNELIDLIKDNFVFRGKSLLEGIE